MGRDEGPNPVDVHVGRRVRLRRKELGLSQDRLADQLGLTFQQIQKYERGANRISASKLFTIGKVLAVPVAYFFEGLDDPANPGDQAYTSAYQDITEALLAAPGGVDLAEAFLNIRRRSVRKALIDVAREIAGSEALNSSNGEGEDEGGEDRFAAE